MLEDSAELLKSAYFVSGQELLQKQQQSAAPPWSEKKPPA